MPRKDTKGQTQIDFSVYGWRRRVLRDVRLPPLKGVSKQTAMLVLDKLDAHDGPKGICPGLELLAAECQGLNEKTIRRAIKALTDLGVLLQKRRSIGDGRKTQNYYTIVWGELATLCPDRINRTFEADQSDICDRSTGHLMSREAIGSHRKPPPNPPAPADGEWLEAAKFFHQEIYSIDRVATVYRQTGKTHADFRRDVSDALAIAGLPEYASRLSSRAGAVVRYLERGLWPLDGMPTIEEYRRRGEVLAQQAIEAQRKRDRDAEYDQIVARERAQRLAQRATLESSTR